MAVRLPDAIERELRGIEAEYAGASGQKAGSPRLRGLRSAIETVVRNFNEEIDALKARIANEEET